MRSIITTAADTSELTNKTRLPARLSPQQPSGCFRRSSALLPPLLASCLFLSVGCASQVKTVQTALSQTNSPRPVVFPIERKDTSLLRQEFAMVTTENERMFLVLSSDPGDEIEASEPFLMSYRENEVVLREHIKSAPESVTGWISQRVDLFGLGKKQCTASVKDVYLQGNLYIDSAEYPFGRDISEEPLTDTEFVQMAWDSGRVLLVAELTNTSGCSFANFGRLSSLGEPTLTTQQEAPVALEDVALQTFRALPEYKEIQADYVSGGYPSFVEGGDEEKETSERWENYDGAKTRVSLFETKDKKQLVSAHVDIWYGCGDFESRLFALWEVQADQSLRLLSSSTIGINPQELVDIDADGSFEIIHDQQWYQMQNNNYQTIEILYIPWDISICGC